MELKECLSTVEKACAAYTGTLREHTVIQTSLATIRSAILDEGKKELKNEPKSPTEKKEE